MPIENLVERIITANRAWKVAKANIDKANNEKEKVSSEKIAERLKMLKSNWQASLIRSYPHQVWLEFDIDNEHSEVLYSVRFGSKFQLSDSSWKHDAEHLPERIAKNILTPQELEQALKLKEDF